ncbi:recombinase RecA [bacterium AH-315-M10]|nr:recombinase RecA [bacterium AH-315-M10]
MAADPRGQAEQSLLQAMERIRQQYGASSIQRLDGPPPVTPGAAISTGSLALDLALGMGGLPRGRISEVFGSEGSGKSTLGLQLIANAQREEGLAGFIDAEHAFDPSYAQQLGVRLPDLVVCQPDDGEQALEILAELVASNALDAIVVDSVAALVPREELAGGEGESDPTLQARMMSRFLRRISGPLGKSRTVLLFVNQMRTRVGQQFGPRDTTPGGRALRFISSVRIQLEISGALIDGQTRVGQRVEARVVKNKLAAPFQTAEFDIVYGQGVVWAREVLALAERLGLLALRDGWYRYGEVTLGRGAAAAIAQLESDPQLQARLEAEAVKRLSS